jgi:hypothetical protein
MSVFRGTTGDGLPNGTPFANRSNQVDAVWRIDRPVGTANAAIRLDWNLNSIEGSNFTTLPNGQIAMWRRDLAVSPFWRVAGTGFANDNVANYSINTTVSDFGTVGTGYPYIVANINVLPGKLIYFKGSRTNESNQLRWEYKDAYQLKNIHVERSLNSIDFMQLTQILPGANQEIFQYEDLKGKDLPVAYYRLKFTDLDGMVTYSQIIQLSGKEKKSPVIIQNPVNNTISLMMPSKGDITISVIDLTGKLYQNMTAKTMENQLLQIPVSYLSPGYYLLRLKSELSVITLPFIKN